MKYRNPLIQAIAPAAVMVAAGCATICAGEPPKIEDEFETSQPAPRDPE